MSLHRVRRRSLLSGTDVYKRQEIYLSGGPDTYSSADERFVFFAGLDENHINGIYFNGKGDVYKRQGLYGTHGGNGHPRTG